MEKEVKNVRCIMLSAETAKLFDCKQKLDECFDKVIDIHKKMYGYDQDFEFKWYDAFVDMNNIIVDLLTTQIDNNSTESNYNVL